jgi:hypothetical protein
VFRVPAYVCTEILLSVAMILKRGTFDNKTGSTTMFYSAIETLVASGNVDKVVFVFILFCNIYVFSNHSHVKHCNTFVLSSRRRGAVPTLV